ncbi:MAG: monovalent cation/H+ antiporter subunit D [Pseudorhodoplanes sp.]
MTHWLAHLIVLPVLVPLLAGALLLLLDERQHALKAGVSVASTLAVLVVAIILLVVSDRMSTASSVVTVYRLGGWPAPFGIVLVLDRLSAVMLVLTSVLALASLVSSLARWARAGPHFHSLFQFLIMGLSGAFLTGDLFNLFVFFEILLAASYGLVLHGSGRARVRNGLHYIAVNLAASALFLIGVSLIYGITGTLNMGDIPVRIPAIADDDRVLFEAGAAILGVAFLVKAGMWPLSFWLPGTYSAAAPPAAAFFAIMTKVGFYVLLRLCLLMFGPDADSLAHFGATVLLAGGMMTIVFGSVGALASQDLPRLASYSLLISSGTLLALIGIGGNPAVTSGALFYMVSSTLTICALFMLIELTERGRSAGADILAVTMEAYGEAPEEEEREDVGVTIPATMAILGISFAACAVLIAGLPPLSGFIAKLLLLRALLAQIAGGGWPDVSSWLLIAFLLLSGFAVVVATVRAGIRLFWLPLESTVPRVRPTEIAPVIGLIFLCAVLTVQAGPAMRFFEGTAADLHTPSNYTRAVLPSLTPRSAGGGS